MGADENQQSRRKFSDDILSNSRPRVNGNNSKENLHLLRRHYNIEAENMNRNLDRDSLQNNLDFPSQNNRNRYPRRSSESYCLDYKKKYTSGKVENAIIKNFVDSVRMYNNE